MTLTVDLILAIVAALVLGGWLGWLARGARIEKQAFDRQIAAYQAPKHAKTQPRQALPPEMERAVMPLPGVQALRRTEQPALRSLQVVRPSEYSGWGPPKRSHTSPANIGQVFLPGKPQPGRTSITDTGELRLQRAADWFEEKRREQAVWSHEFAQRCEADRKELLA